MRRLVYPETSADLPGRGRSVRQWRSARVQVALIPAARVTSGWFPSPRSATTAGRPSPVSTSPPSLPIHVRCPIHAEVGNPTLFEPLSQFARPLEGCRNMSEEAATPP